MKPITLTTFLLFANASFSQSSVINQGAADEPRTIVTSILKTLEEGWNKANGVAFAQPFAEESEFVDIRGTLHQQASRQYLGEAHQGVFSTIYKDSKISYSLVQAIPVDAHTILANVNAALDSPAGPLAGKSSSTISILLIKTGSDWKIRAFHNTLVAKQ